MKSFFAARTEEIKRELEARAGYRKKFFTEDCWWDSRRRSVERSEAEKIVKICNSETEKTVETEETKPFTALRYVLVPIDQSWLIKRVEVFREGQGWISHQDVVKRRE